MKRFLGRLGGISLATVAGLIWVSTAAATTSTVSRSYASDVPITPGSIVSLTTLQSKTVTLANTTNSDKIIGVSVSDNGSLIAIEPGNSRIQVITSGQAEVLVSDLNGDIAIGDKVAVSPFDGIGMKSSPGERVIGLAQTAFKSNTKSLTTKDVTDKQGNSKALRIARVQISVIIGNDDASARDQSGAQRLVKSATGRTVSKLRAFVSIVIAGLAMIALLVLIYSAVYGSIISIGRNPLAKNDVFAALRNVLYIAGMVLLLALVFIYLLTR